MLRGWVPLDHLAVFEMQTGEAMEKRPISDDRQAPMLSAHPGPEFFYTPQKKSPPARRALPAYPVRPDATMGLADAGMIASETRRPARQASARHHSYSPIALDDGK